MVVYMGGVCPDKMQPGIGDYGVANGAEFIDLNTVDPNHDPEHAVPQEYVSESVYSRVCGIWVKSVTTNDLVLVVPHLTAH
jgi:hypothetical protein